jgi:hypothetical protein
MEGRRGARVATTFLVALEEIEKTPQPRQGDISTTGVYFETPVDVGPTGTIHWIHLVSIDHAKHLRVMAYVVRGAMVSKSSGEHIRGAAFEFMPESDEAIAAVQDFVKYVLGRRASGMLPQISPHLDADAAAGSDKAPSSGGVAVVRKLSVRSMVLETSWAVIPGESLRVDIAAPGMTRRIRLEGKAVRVLPGKTTSPSTYTIEVEVHEETDRPLRHDSSMGMMKVAPPASAAPAPDGDTDETLRQLDDLLSSLIVPPSDDSRRKRAHHLAGQLSSVHLPTLLSLFDMERMTGELTVRHDIEEVRIYVDAGILVDIEPLHAGETARARLRAVLGWHAGSFEFDMLPVERENRIGMSTTALLLDLARQHDEESQH